jgi:polyferredoxin
MATQATATTSPGLQQLLPYVISGGSVLFSGILLVFRSLIHLVSASSRSILIFSPLPVALYLLAPAFVFLQVTTDLFMVLPYRIVLAFLDVVFPLYVFCGVACITGALVGFSGRLLTSILVEAARDEHMRSRKLQSVKRGKRARVKVES